MRLATIDLAIFRCNSPSPKQLQNKGSPEKQSPRTEKKKKKLINLGMGYLSNFKGDLDDDNEEKNDAAASIVRKVRLFIIIR